MSDTWGENDKPAPTESWGSGDKEVRTEPKPRGLKGWAGDIAATAVRGAIAVPELAVGLADIPTGGAVGKFLENRDGVVGFRPKQAKEAVSEALDSDVTKDQNRQFQEADGIVEKAKVALSNPSMIARAVGESLPSMGAGGVAARGLMGATRLGQMGAKGAAIAGAAGEGATMAGAQAEAIRQETEDGRLTPMQSGLAAATGLVGGAFGAAGGALTRRLGVGDADTLLAQGTKGAARQNADDAALAATNPLTATNPKSIPRSVIEGAVAEGLLEELPQSLSEQLFQNLALGKDWTEDLDAAAVMGVLTGGAMGGGAAAYSSMTRPTVTPDDVARSAAGTAPQPDQPQPPEPTDQLALPAPVIEVGADGTARTAEDRNARLSRINSGDVTDVTPIPKRPSEAMGLNPAAGPMSAAAALAVDTGVTDGMQAAAGAQQALSAFDEAEAAALKNRADTPVIDYADLDEVDRRYVDSYFDQLDKDTDKFLNMSMEDDDGIPDFGDTSTTSDEDFLRSIGANDQEIQDAIQVASGASSPQEGARGDVAPARNDASGTQEGAGQAQATQAQGVSNGPQADQTQQGSAQQAQGGTAQTATGPAQGQPEPASTAAAPVAAATVDGSATTANAGAQAAPAPSAQGAEDRAARDVRVAEAGAMWTRMPTVERQGLADRLADKITNVAQRKNLHRLQWGTMNSDLQRKIAEAIVPANTAPALTGKAQAATETVAPSVVQTAAADAAMSPENDRPEPTQAQREAGNYKKGHARVAGLDISIETPSGTRRRPEWPPLQDHYGYIKGTVGVDKDHVDVFLTDRAEDESLPVFVVDQNKRDGSLDEHKVIMGAATEEEARATYLRNYGKGWTGLGGIAQMTQDEFKDWVRDPVKTKNRAAPTPTEVKNADTAASGVRVGDERATSDAPVTTAGPAEQAGRKADAQPAGARAGAAAAPVAGVQSAVSGRGDASQQAADVDPSADRWASATPAQREAILLAAGWKTGSPATTTLKGQDWVVFNAAQRRRLVAGMESTQEGGAGTAPATQATAAPTAETRKPETPASGKGETGAKQDPWTSEEEARLVARIGRNGGVVTKDMGGHFYAEVAVSNNDTKGIRAHGANALYAKRALLKKLEEQKSETPAPSNDETSAYVLYRGPQEGGFPLVIDREAMMRDRLAREGQRLQQPGMAQDVADAFTAAGLKQARESFDANGKFIAERYQVTVPSRGIYLFGTVSEAREFAEITGMPKGKKREMTAVAKPAAAERNPDGRPKTPADKAMERIAAEDAADRAAAPQPPAEKPKKKPSADQTRAKADLMAALADLGDILGKNTRMNMLPEQEQKLLPVLTRLLDAAFRLGYAKFKDSAKFALDQIRTHLGDEAADALTLDHLQGAYIAMAGGKQGTDTKRAVIDVETKAEIEAHEATQEQDDEPAARPVESTGVPTLAGEQPADGGAPAQVGPVADAAGPSGRTDGQADANAAGVGAVAPGSVGGSTASPVPAAGARGRRANGTGRGSRTVRGSAADAGQRADAGGEGGVGEGPGDNPAPNAPLQHAPQFQPTDFTITEDFALGEGGEKTKYQANVAAIRLLQELEAAGRMATPAEQAVLARYVGWGGLANAFEGGNPAWAREQAELKALLSPEDYAAAARSTRYAHYTSREIVQDGIYAALKRFGFTGGKVLEGGGGVGNFIGLMPESMRAAGRVTAVEREPIAAGIAKHLYPQQNMVQEDFTRFAGTDDYYDAAVGNPPFASDPQTDQSNRKHLSGLSLHNYFFAKEVDMLREGGILAQVVTNSFLDSKGDTARRYISDRTKFLGAIRLPNNAFSKNAGTEVTTDLIFLQKRPESEWGGRAARAEAKAWLDIGAHQDKNGRTVALNQYFIDNPSMMLGDFGAFGTMYRANMTALVAREGQDTAALLKEAVARLPENIYVSAAVQGTTNQVNAAIVALKNPPVTEGGFFEQDGKLIRREPDLGGEARGTEITPNTQWTEKTKLGDAGFARIQGMARMRTTLRNLIAAEMSNDDAGMGKLRAELNQQYDAFTAANGFINDPANARVFDDDPDYPLLASLEHGYTPAIGPAAAKAAGIKPVKSTAKKATIFERRVVAERRSVTKVETPADALAVSMAERGRLDTAYIGQLLGQDPEEALHTLTTGEKPLLFKDPGTGEYVLRDAYLSGNVRAKLETAKQAGVFSNVKALEAVQPADVGAHEIVAKVGSPWVPESVYEDFAKELFGEGTTASVRYTKANSSYGAYIRPGNAVANANTWGTPSYTGTELLSALLNNRQIKVLRDGPNKTRVVDVDATEAANIKAQDIRNKFSDWLFTDGDRSELLVRAYNDTNNNYVVRKYDGSFLTFPGKVPDMVVKGDGGVTFRRHQRNAISRIVQDRTALLDHEVGAGKTYTVISGMMELKRTGLANKPMVIVPNHLVKQWAADWYRLYPGANILTATKKDFEKDNRRRFLAKIATGDWDAVIMAHSSFGFIKPAPEFEAKFNEKQIALVVEAIKSVENSDAEGAAKKRTVKQLEGLKERLENRIKNLRNKPMDALLDFEQLGVDQLAVDEAHMFKNLMFSTKLQNVQGLGDSAGSQRAYDLYVKANQLYAKNGRGQGVVFATGTPVSNSLAEMYHMMRYLMPAQMEELGFQSFDAWANTFASVEQVWMQKPSGDGFKASNRMSNFVNTPELLHMFDQVSDTVTMADIKAAYSEENDGKEFPIPPLKTGRRQPISLKKSPAQEAYMEVLAERARAVEERKGPPKKGEDNVLVIMADGRKAAMDIRLVDLDATEREPGGRIDRAADEAMARYRKYDAVKGTQLFFSDLGTPLKHAKAELKEYEALQARIDAIDEDTRAMAAFGNESAQGRIDDADAAQAEMDSKGADWLDAVKAAMRGFSIYDDLKAALIERGVPEREIAFIHDYNTDEQKASLFRKVNAGDIRFVVGSTQKMGAGTNVQERLVAEHHLDVPWRPSDIEQREGRIIRQGNELLNKIPGFEVEVLAYVTQDTLDMRMWQVQETKLKMINQLRTRQIAREIDNAFEDMEMSASEMQAAATGNPDLLTEIQLKTEVKRLETRKRSFDAQQSDLQSRRKRNARELEELPVKIERGRGVAAKAQAYVDGLSNRYDGWKATIDGKEYATPADASRYLQDTLEAAREPSTEEGKPGKGLPIRIVLNGEAYTSRKNLADAFKELTGDRFPILWEVDGKRLIERSKIATAIRTNISDAVAEQSVKPIGTIGGFAVTVEPGRDKLNNLVLDIVATNGDDQLTGEINVGQMGRDGEADPMTVYMAGDRVIQKVEGMLDGAPTELRWDQSRLESAKKTAKELASTAGTTEWPDAAKLEDARKKHREILDRLAKAKKPDAAPKAAADTSEDFAAASGQRVGTPTDRAVMGLARAGAGGQDVLKLIAGTSRNMQNRRLADALVKANITPKVVMGGDLGGGDGYRYIAKYSNASNTITMTENALGQAEQIFLHEAVHAATVQALGRPGMAALQINRLYQHVMGQENAVNQYGMTNVREFVAEAFTNPEFQAALKAMPAPRGNALRSAWDALVRIVRDLLGLTIDPTPGNTVLDEVMRAGPALMRENAASTGRGNANADIAFAAAPDTEAFKRWFGDSKVVDADGKPLAVYHGTQRAFSVFAEEYIGDGADATSNMGDFGDGYYFTNSAKDASGYAGNSEGSNVMPVYLSIKNPIDAGKLMDIEGVDGMLQDPYPGESLRNLLEQLGYDGIIVNGGEEIIAFRPSQIKSATGNRGTYDPADADISYFGMAEARDVKTNAMDYLNQTMSHEGKVSVWDKTVGTMRNLAERQPLFKPVFEAAQRFIDDVSMLANDAADFAPRLLPRVETIGDIFGKNRKNPISAEDNKAVARPLFEGTLMWARDVDGKAVLVDDLQGKYQNLPTAEKAQLLLRAGRLDPQILRMWQGWPLEQFDNVINSQFESKMLKPGLVWSDKELAEIFKANAQQISLYREARAGIDRSLDMTMRTDMLRLLGQDYAAMRDAVLEAPTIADARDLLTDTLMAEARENPDQSDRLTKLNNDVVKRYERATELMAEGYAPLSRFGRYTVDVVDKDGERLYFGMFESARESNIMRMRMVEQYPGATVTAGTMSDQAYKLFAGVTPESLEQFGEMLGLDATGDEAKDKAFQAYLQLAKNNHSALKRLIHRKGIAGYSEDVGRVMASFIYSNARLGAGGLNAGTMENAIEAIPKEQGELKDVAMRLRSYISDPQEEGQAIRGMLFAQYLGGSIASAFVNTTQPFAVTLPWLSQFGGMKKAGAALGRAMRDMGTKGFKYDPELANAMKHAEDDGVVQPQEIHQLMAQSRGAGSLRSGDGTRSGDARAAAANAWERTKVAWGQPFALAEQFNRRSTFIAAFRLAKQEGMKNPAGFARRAVLETQFLYSKANKPRWARGAIGGTLMTFKTYSISYLELLNRTWNAGEPGSPERAAGRRAVGWAVATLLLMGGAGGLPFMEDLEDLIDGAGQLMGYNMSAKQARQQFLREIVGKEVADFIENGVSGMPGAPIDVSGRLGMGNLLPGTGLLLTKPSRERDLMEIAGPAGDLVARGFSGARKVLTGDVGGAAMEVAPTAVRNAAKGIDMAVSGIYKDTKGYKVIDTTLDEALAKAIGFQPKSVAKVQEANSFMQRSKSFYTQTSSEIKAQWADALFRKDDAAVERVRERLDDWNRQNPEQKIVIKMPDVWKRAREMGKDRTDRIAATAPKALRQQMRAMAEDAP